MRNQTIAPEQIEKIRGLDDFDLIMLISEVHDYGWPSAAKVLAQMPEGVRRKEPT